MAAKLRIYRRTEAGKLAWESQDAKVPAECRRVLGLVETDAHTDVIRGFLRRHSDKLIFEWLGKLEQLGLLESTSAGEQHDLDFTASFKFPALIAEDRKRLAQDAQIAGAVIADKGAYLSAERLQNGVISMRAPSETVVLIVEDDPDQAALAELRVAAAGYSVALAASVEDMTKAFRQGIPDLLLLDVMLPDGDGFEVLGKLRRHADYALLPIVMLTVKADATDIQRGLALGADGYVTKPYSKDVLADTIGRVLKRE